MKMINKILTLLALLVTTICVFGSFNNIKVSASSEALSAGKEITINDVAGKNLNNINLKIEFTTTVNLDGTNNALLVGLVSADGTKLTDERFVVGQTNVVFDKNDISVYFDQNTPLTIGSKTGTESFTYSIETRDFTVLDETKDIAKLVVVGQKGTVINSEVSVSEVKYSVKFGSNTATDYSYKQAIASAPATNPTKDYDDTYHYVFDKWVVKGTSTEFAVNQLVTADIEFEAKFTSVAHSYGDWQTSLEPGCETDGSKHKDCSCGHQIVESIPAAHKISKVDAKTETCTVDGNIEYWTCTVCHKMWKEATCENLYESANDVVVAHHSSTHTEAKEPTCTVAGNIEYWTCSCNKIYSDEAKTNAINFEATVVAAHTEEHIAKVEATCTTAGNIEYWTCSCGKKYSDSAKTTQVTDAEIVLAAHGSTHTARVEATCTTAGNIEYWTCSCNKIYSDEAKTNEITSAQTVIAAHTEEHTARVEATCKAEGNIEYWTCSCGKKYSDSAKTTQVTDAEIVIAKHHTPVHHDLVPSQEFETGTKEHWVCSCCNGIFLEAGCVTAVTEADLVIEANHVHDAKSHTEAKASTCTETGNDEYWTCSCGVKFDDEDCTEEFTGSLEIAALQHDYEYSSIVWTNYTAKAVYVCSHDNSHKEEHDCTVTNEITTVATCVVNGVKTYTAAYDGHTDTETEDLGKNANNHDLEHHDAKAPTCTEIGWEAYDTCKKCDYTTYVEKAAIKHNYEFKEIVWTNFTAKAVYVCSNDNSHKEEHDCTVTNEVTTDPTCEGKGVRTYTATYDGHTDTKTEELNSIEHDFEFKEIVWTNFAAKAVYVCANDNTHKEEHDCTVTNEITTVATCVVNGVKTYTATYDGHTDTKTEDLGKNANNHDLEHHDAKAPTCTEIGWEAYDTCKNCDYTTYVEKAAIKHNYEFKEIVWDGFNAKAIYVCANNSTHKEEHTCTVTNEITTVSTCSVDGIKTYTATYDGHSDTKTENLGKNANNHDIEHHNAKAPTCTEIGWDAYDTCKNCDYTTYVEKAAIKHNYEFKEIVWTNFTAKAVYVCANDNTHKEEHDCTVTNEVTTVATCSVDGIKTYTATYDGHTDTKTENLGKNTNNHDLEHHDAKAPTCTEVGWDSYDTCKNCDYSTKVEKAALQHNYEFKEIVWTNFTAKAIYVCANDSTHKEEHACTVTNEITTVATCVVNGVKTYTATYDGHSDTKTENLGKNANNHNLEYYAAKDATTEEEGIIAHYHCSDCGKNFLDASCTMEVSNVTLPKLEKGCFSVVSATGIIGLLAAACFLFARRKETEIEQ